MTNPSFFSIVASVQFGIRGCDGPLNSCPFLLTIVVLRYPCLKTSFVSVRARIAYVLIAICFGKEDRQTYSACHFGMCSIEALDPRNCGSQVDNVLKGSFGFLRIGRWRLHDAEKTLVLVDKRFIVGIEVRWRNSVFIRPSNFGRQ